LTETSVAGFILLQPVIKIKPVKRDRASPIFNLGDVWTDFPVKNSFGNSEITAGIREPENSRLNGYYFARLFHQMIPALRSQGYSGRTFHKIAPGDRNKQRCHYAANNKVRLEKPFSGGNIRIFD
jgi:hypothetical protein